MTKEHEASRKPSKSGLRTLLICLLANNLTLGATSGSFGALLAQNEEALGVGRDVISFGMSAFTTMMSLTALVMGNLVRRLTPSYAIAIGVACGVVAFTGLGMSLHIGAALAFWALLGFSAALAAILGPVAIAVELFPSRTGKALSIINLPIALFVGPWAMSMISPELGRKGTYLILAALLLPVFGLALRLPAGARPEGTMTHSETSVRAITGRADFWCISLAVAVIAGSGAAFMVHAIAYAQASGMTAPVAALMISAYSGAGLLGVPAFGWLADRIGAPRALALSASVQCLCWGGLSILSADCFLILSALLGAATTPLTTLHGATMAQLFGTKDFGRALGIGYAIKLPFFFLLPPAIGYAFVILGDYRPAFAGLASCLVATIILLVAGCAALPSRAPLPDRT